MTHQLESTSGELSQLDPRSPRALHADDRRHLTRFLVRHCVATPLLDTCVEGHGPLPVVMDRFVRWVVNTHRHLSGGTFVDAGDRLDVHPQSLRVLARKVNAREVGPGSLLVGEPQDWSNRRILALMDALLRGGCQFSEADLLEFAKPWVGAFDAEALSGLLEVEESLGHIRRGNGRIIGTNDKSSESRRRQGRSSIAADLIADAAAIHLAAPILPPRKPGPVRMVHTRAVMPRGRLEAHNRALRLHLQETLQAAVKKYRGSAPRNLRTVCIALASGPSSMGLRSVGTPERDIWLGALARHLARYGGLREAMPIMYQEVARELRRRSEKRAYDVDLLKAVGRARQNVHEWEAGRGFHFRGPAPVTVVDDSPDSLTEAQLHHCARVFLQERSHRPCKVDEFSAWLQKEIGVHLDELMLIKLLEGQVIIGAARPAGDGSDLAFQAVKSYRRVWAQNVAQRRANVELTIQTFSSLIAGNSAGWPNTINELIFVQVERENASSFVTDVLINSADYQAQLFRGYEDLEPEHDDAVDMQVAMTVSPVAFPLSTSS